MLQILSIKIKRSGCDSVAKPTECLVPRHGDEHCVWDEYSVRLRKQYRGVVSGSSDQHLEE